MASDASRLRELVESPIEALGYELVHIELTVQDKSNVLRVYIDAPGGIRVDDCERVSRQVSAILDVEEPLQSAYLLEVSSPGLDRPLVQPQHFQRFAGERARVVMNVGVSGRRKFVGELMEADEQRVLIEVKGERYELAYADMDSARLEPVF